MKLTLDEEYKRVKEQHKQSILFYQVGQFYQTYYYDAELFSKECGFQLKSRTMGGGIIAPVCGIPLNTLDKSIEQLTKARYSVVVYEQHKSVEVGKEVVSRIKCGEFSPVDKSIDLTSEYEVYMGTYSYEKAKDTYDREQLIKSEVLKIKKARQESVQEELKLREVREKEDKISDNMQRSESEVDIARKILEELRLVALEQMTPMECMVLISKWKKAVI